jgi:hypothetical protein
MGDQNGKPPLTRRVPGATRAAPADPELRKPPELPESIRQRIQAVVNAAHAQAAQEAETGHEQAPSQGHPGRGTSAGSQSGAAGTAGAANPPNRPVGWPPPTPTGRPPGTSPYQDAEFDTAPIPRPAASGAIASPDVNGSGPQPAQSAPRNGADRTDQPVRQDRGRARHGARGHASGQERERAEQAAREQAAARERAREERERLARLERERLAAEEHARKQKERDLRQGQKQAVKQAREQAAEQKRAAREERERAARERARQERERAAQERAAQERAGQERERAEQERARQEQERERVRLEQEREDREWAAMRRARLERERAEAGEQAELWERAARREREQAEADAAHRLQEQAELRERAAKHEREQAEADAAHRLQEQAEQDRLAEPGHGADSERAALLWREVQADFDALAERPIQAEPAPAQRDAPAEPAVQPRPLEAEATRRRRYLGPALVAAAALLVAAGWLVFGRSPRAPAHVATHPPKPTAAQLTRDARNQAAAWIAQQVSSTAAVACDPVMCLALRSHGVQHLFVLLPNATDPAGQIIVATAAVRKQFGSRLAVEYAPAVIASFGSGRARIDIRQAYPDGEAAFQAALRTDLQNRKLVEKTLTGNLQIALSAQARQQLTDGAVDARLSELIEGMSTSVPPPLDILYFGDLGPGASAGIPLRSAIIGGSVATLRAARAFALGQTGNLRPAHAAVSTLNGQSVLTVEFAVPIPLGVFNPQSP